MTNHSMRIRARPICEHARLLSEARSLLGCLIERVHILGSLAVLVRCCGGTLINICLLLSSCEGKWISDASRGWLICALGGLRPRRLL